jgi:hypothetical protein
MASCRCLHKVKVSRARMWLGYVDVTWNWGAETERRKSPIFSRNDTAEKLPFCINVQETDGGPQKYAVFHSKNVSYLLTDSLSIIFARNKCNEVFEAV